MPETRTIGVIVPLLAGSFASRLLDGIYHTAQQNGIEVIACEGSPAEIGAMQLAIERVSGWIVFLDSTGIEHFTRRNVPIVAVSTDQTGLCPTVLPDNWGGIQAVMSHLFDHGHERIAFIGTMDNQDIQQRRASYEDALANRGLPVDPSLIIDTNGYLEPQGYEAVRALLESGAEFSAIVTAGDFNAFGAIAALREAGRRVPEDVAVTGFDDIPTAQFADPPLTTVRQRPESLGELAVDTLLAIISGLPVERETVFASTALVPRYSCGCAMTQIISVPDMLDLTETGWKDLLVTRLARLVLHPLPLAPGAVPARIWPGAAWLVDQLDAVVQGAPIPDIKAMEQPWREALALTDHLDILYAMLRLLDSAADQRLDRSAADQRTRERTMTFLDYTRLAMMRVRLDDEVVMTDMLEHMARTNERIDNALLGDDTNVGDLSWMEATAADWACLGLWESPPGSDNPTLRLIGVYQRTSQPGHSGVTPADIQPGGLIAPADFPPAELIKFNGAPEVPSNIVLLPVASETRAWGLLAMRLPIARQIISELHGLKRLAPRISGKLERDLLLKSLRDQQEILTQTYEREREQQQTLSQAYERERALTTTLRELGCPILPVLENVLLVPLIGAIDSDRAQQIIEVVLDGVRRYNAEFILLDVTAVPLVDTQVANSLLQTANATKLLGARTIMVGVRPEIAQSIIGLGLDLSEIITYPSLALALTSLGRNQGLGADARRS